MEIMENRFYVCKHGLLYVVYEKVDTGMDEVSVKDSSWEDEEKAKLHCRILNNDTQMIGG